MLVLALTTTIGAQPAVDKRLTSEDVAKVAESPASARWHKGPRPAPAATSTSPGPMAS